MASIRAVRGNDTFRADYHAVKILVLRCPYGDGQRRSGMYANVLDVCVERVPLRRMTATGRTGLGYPLIMCVYACK